MRYATVPIFVPHMACPNDCVFCNQKRIAGTEEPLENLDEFLRKAKTGLSSKFDRVDIAFFGGSFTGIEETRMISYLEVADKYLGGKITGLRLSTRPDYISEKILDILKKHGVTTIELGAQSMDNEVLRKSRRGHTSEQTVYASRLIKEYGFELVLQFMPGLPGDTEKTIMETVDKIINIKPDAVRVYPCVVIKDTQLEKDYYNGNFVPLTLEQAICICAKIARTELNIIRMGLHGSDLVKSQSVVAGPFHPAFGELVTQQIYYENAAELFTQNPPKENTVIYVHPGCCSKMIGNKRKNIIELEKKFGIRFTVKENKTLDYDKIERNP